MRTVETEGDRLVSGAAVDIVDEENLHLACHCYLMEWEGDQARNQQYSKYCGRRDFSLGQGRRYCAKSFIEGHVMPGNGPLIACRALSAR
ncbi:hypothetical protein GCM10020369_40340 [Cryptosporangium minutisporangium]|uniref:Uncharacterized protein n=1 Tax=Cryptosporangium minutisporangium TaxID=113569 RepID=A0ABP6T1R0_9ACTN